MAVLVVAVLVVGSTRSKRRMNGLLVQGLATLAFSFSYIAMISFYVKVTVTDNILQEQTILVGTTSKGQVKKNQFLLLLLILVRLGISKSPPNRLKEQRSAM